MKKLFVFICAAAFLLSCTETGEKQFTTAAEYDSVITNNVTQMQQSLFAVQAGIEDSIAGDAMLKKYAAHIDSMGGYIKKMPAFEENKSYRDAAGQLADFYKKSVGTYYTNIANILKEKNDTSATTKVNEILAKVQDEEAAVDAVFHKERQAFIDKNGIKDDYTHEH